MLTDPLLTATLRRHYLFNGLPEQGLAEIAAHTCVKRLPQGASLFHQGDVVQRREGRLQSVAVGQRELVAGGRHEGNLLVHAG